MKHFHAILLLSLLCCAGIPSFAQEVDSLAVEKEPLHSISIEMADNRIKINNLKQDAILEIYNILGVKVYNRRIPPGTNEYPINLPRGYYIIRVGNKTKKIAIR